MLDFYSVTSIVLFYTRHKQNKIKDKSTCMIFMKYQFLSWIRLLLRWLCTSMHVPAKLYKEQRLDRVDTNIKIVYTKDLFIDATVMY